MFSLKPSLFSWRSATIAGVALATVFGSATAHANPFETTLKNGMKVIVKEDRRAPSVVHMVWYRAGSMDEQDGVSGIAHLLEHMMFKGTKKVGPGEFNKLVAAAGGRDNAFTSRDYTAYFQQIPPERLGEMMELEADRMANLIISDDEFKRELEVVKEERRLRTDDQPQSLVYEQLMATAFQSHPYRRPVIGWMADLEGMRPDDARNWYQTWYSPNNAYLVVTGDVDHTEVFRQAEKHYGKIVARPLPARRIPAEPVQWGPRSTTVKAPAELPSVVLAWPVPSVDPDPNKASNREAYALDVLASILSGYDGARLNRNLVRDTQIALSADAGYDGIGRGPSLFYLTATPSPGHTIEAVETALRQELHRIQNEGIHADELNRVKTQAIAAQIYRRDSLMGQAMEIGMLESANFSWRDEQRLLDGLRNVTAEDVQAVAQRYFGNEHLSRAQLDPLPLNPAKPRATLSLPHD